MLKPSIDTLLDKVPSKFTIVKSSSENIGETFLKKYE